MILFGFSIEVYFINLAIAFPTYFFLRWLINRRSYPNNKLRKTLPWIGTVMLTPIIYLSLIFLWIFSISYYPSQAFDQDVWKQQPDERFELTEDLIESKTLTGLNKEEVIKLLGQYDYAYDENHWAYDIGFVPGPFNIDPSVLDVYFENGRVIKVSRQEN